MTLEPGWRTVADLRAGQHARYGSQVGHLYRLPRAVVLASALQLQGELEDQAQRIVATQLTIGGGISALALLCIWLMAQRIVAPIRAVVARLRTSPAGGSHPAHRSAQGMTR